MFSYWPVGVENRAAIRTSIAALAAILIAFKFHLQTPYWAGMTVIVVTNLYTGSIIDKAMMRIIGTICGAFLGFYLAGIVANSFFLYLLACFLIIAISVYYYQYSRYGYAYLLGALCALIILSQITINPQNAFFVAIWRPVEIGLGVVVSALSVYLIFPNHLKDSMLKQVDELYCDFAAELNQLLLELSEGRCDVDALLLANLKLKKKIRKAMDLIDVMNHELGVSASLVDKLRVVLDSFMAMTRQIHFLISIPLTPSELSKIQGLSVSLVASAMSDDLTHLQAAFSKNTESFELHTAQAIEVLERQSAIHNKSKKINGSFVYSFITVLHELYQSFLIMHSQVMPNHIIIEKTQPKQYKAITRQHRMRADIELIKHSIKAGLSVLLALCFWMVSNWPGGINGIISSLMISIRKNLFEMKNIMIHRIIGCTLGGGLALVSLAVVEMNLYDLVILLFLAVWGFTYFMFKYPKYAYIGLQANIALIIALAQEGGPPTLLDPPLQRLAGVFIGISASFIVANVLWRADVWSQLARYLKRLRTYELFNLRQVLLCSDEDKTLHELGNLFWLTRGLLESLSDAKLSPKKQEQLSTLRQEFDSLVIIQATISAIFLSINRAVAHKTAAVFGLDLLCLEHTVVSVLEEQDKTQADELSKELKLYISKIEKKARSFKIEGFELRQLQAYLNALKQLISVG